MFKVVQAILRVVASFIEHIEHVHFYTYRTRTCVKIIFYVEFFLSNKYSLLYKDSSPCLK